MPGGVKVGQFPENLQRSLHKGALKMGQARDVRGRDVNRFCESCIHRIRDIVPIHAGLQMHLQVPSLLGVPLGDLSNSWLILSRSPHSPSIL